MPPKRKPAPLADAKVLKMAKRESTSESESSSAAAARSSSASTRSLVPIRPSSHEKPRCMLSTPADNWPNGLKSWPAVLRATAFYTLLGQRTETSWQAALLVARSRPTEPIDLSLLPDSMKPVSARNIWFCNGFCANNPELLIQMYRVISDLVVGDQSDSFMFYVTSTYHIHLVGECTVFGGQCKYCELCSPHVPDERIAGRRSTYEQLLIQWKKSAADAAASSDGSLALQRHLRATDPDQLYRTLNADLNPLFAALHRLDLLVGLLEQLPILELDVFEKKEDVSAESPEYWLRNASGPNLHEVFKAARSYMERYRRERGHLLRTLLSDVLTFDLFDLIDAYGGAPLRKAID
jgi:hypothetical protein